ncbi:MAG TPA: MazG family protein [Solirubrobacteraceae bacterium]|jgi:MazG family protein
MPEGGNSEALIRLDALTRRLRSECPWDREQDERSIVAHTVEEAYELADAAHERQDAKLLDELGDVLFQVHFLALLLEERGAGDLAQVAEHCSQKLIRRHPHVFAEVEVADADEVLRNWDQIKRREPGRERGVFGEVPENLPALLYARKIQRRAACAGECAEDAPELSLAALRGKLDQLCAVLDEESPEGPSAGESARPEAFHQLGELLFVVVALARGLKLDPELALRAAAHRFREKIGEG